MGLLDRIANSLSKRVTQELMSKSANFKSPMFVGSNVAVYNNTDTHKLLEEGYLGNTEVYSIISFLARKFASIPLNVYTIEDESSLKKYQRITRGDFLTKGALQKAQLIRNKAISDQPLDNDLSRLLQRPNEYQGQDQFLENLYGFKLSAGAGALWVNRGGLEKGRPVEINVLPSHFIYFVPDPNDLWGWTGFKLNVAGGYVPLRKEDVLYWGYPNPEFDAATRTHLYGLSPLKAAHRTLTASNAATDAGVALHQNLGSHGILVQDDLFDVTEAQIKLIDAAVNRKINGIDNMGKVAALQGKWRYENLSMGGRDLQVIEAMEANMAKLCGVYGCPSGLFKPDATYANREQDVKTLLTNKILPECSSLRDELNRWLLPMFGLQGKAFIDFDFAELPELQDDMEKLVNSLKAADWLTYDEKREAMSYESKGGAYATAYVQNTVIPIDEVQTVLDSQGTSTQDYNDQGTQDNNLNPNK